MAFHEYPKRQWHDILPHASAQARDLISKLVCFESGMRLPAEEVLKHPLFDVV